MEQLTMIFNLCGSPSKEYWRQSKTKLPPATKIILRQPYKRCIREALKDFPPSSLPLIDTLLAIDPRERQTATAALKTEVSFLSFSHYFPTLIHATRTHFFIK